MALTDPKDYKKRKGVPVTVGSPQKSGGLTSPEDYLKRTKAIVPELTPRQQVQKTINEKGLGIMDTGKMIDTFINRSTPQVPDIEIAAQYGMTPQELAATRAANEIKYKKQFDKLERMDAQQEKIRDIPVIGNVLKSADRVVETIKPATDIAERFYQPGAGPAVISAATQGAGYGIAKLLPKLVNTRTGRVAQTALREASVGAPVGAGLELTHTQDLNKAAEGALWGAGTGLGIGAIGKLGKEGIKAFRQRGLNRELNNFIDRVEPKGTTPDSDIVNMAHPSGRIIQDLPGGAVRKRVTPNVKPKVPNAPEPITPVKPIVNIGDEAIPTSVDGTELRGPTKILDVQSKDGVQYYRFDGSNTYFPENQVKPAGAAGINARTNAPVPPTANPASSAPPAAGGGPSVPPAPAPAPVPPAVTPPVPAQAAPTPPTPPTSRKTITRTDLVNNIKRKLGVTIDTGRTGHRSALGVYKVQPEVIRTKHAQDHDTIAHEIGHHFVKKHGIAEQRFETELTQMMDTVGTHPYRQYPRTEWLDEGVAEYLRVYLADPNQARQLAPRYSAFLDQKLPKNVLKSLNSVQKDVKTWLDQGEYNQAKGMLDLQGDTINKPATMTRLITKYLDDLHPIEVMEKALKGAVGIGSKSIYKLARLSRGVGEQAKMAITRGIFDSQGNKLSEGLSNIVRPLEKVGMMQDDFATYLSAIHAQDLKGLGKVIPFTDSQMDAVFQKWRHVPEVVKAQKEIVKFNNALMDLLVESQIYDPVTVTRLRKRYPNYVPFMRYFDDDAIEGFKNGGYGSSSGFANVLNPVKRMSEEGSSRTIINPLESMVKNSFLIMNAAAKNKVGLQLSNLSRVDGSGAWVERVPGGSSSKEHIVNVWENGKQHAFKIRDPELHSALLALDHESANTAVTFLSGATSMLRAGATLTPEFMVRNVFRDVLSAIVNSSKYGFNPIDFGKGMYHTVKKTEVFEKFVNSGGAMSTMAAIDRDANREAMEIIFRKSLKDKTMNVVTSPSELAKYLSGYRAVTGTVKFLRKGAEISELSTKVGAFNKVLKKTGDVTEAAYTARDLMDFNRAGSAIRQMNKMVAFLNASLQGTNKMYRSFKEDPGNFTARAVTTLMMPAAALYVWNQNLPPEMKKRYDNIPQFQKDTFFVIGIPGLNEFVRIPKPFELGMLFATSTERVVEWLHTNEPEAFKGYFGATANSMVPPVLFTALTPLLEALTNYSFFRKSPVVPQAEQRMEKKDQYSIYTSELAKEISGIMDKIGLGGTNAASPRVIDNTIKGYTAGLGAYATDLIDKGIETVRGKNPVATPAKKPTELPLARSFFVSTSGGGQIREDFYKKWNKVEKAKNSADFNEKVLPIDDQVTYMRMKPFKTAIDKLMKVYKLIQRSEDYTAEKKRSLLDDLDGKMNEAARKAVAVGK